MKLFVFVALFVVATTAVLGEEVSPSKDDAELKSFMEQIKKEEDKMIDAYNKVLDVLSKTIATERQSNDGLPLVLQQLQDNLNQFGSSISEVGSLVRRVVTTSTSDVRKTVLNQFRGFTDLWSKHMRDISKTLEGSNSMRQEPHNQGLIEVANRYVQNLAKNVRNFYTDLFHQLRNRVNSNLPPN